MEQTTPERLVEPPSRPLDQRSNGGVTIADASPKRRKKPERFIGSKRGSVTAQELRERITGLGMSIREFAKRAGRSERYLRSILAEEIPAPCSIPIELAYLELLKDLAALVEGPGDHRINRRATRLLLERHVPPVRKPPAPPQVKAASKPPRSVRKPRKVKYRVKTYDKSRYEPWPEPEHPVTSGYRTGFGSIKSG